MTEQTTTKKTYEAPHLTVVTVRAEHGYAMSDLAASFGLGDAFTAFGNDAWSGGSTGGSTFNSGWTDEGGSAWI